jgi:hypothetical protein
MLITFKTSAYSNIIMFGDVGLQLLEMMDFGKLVPGAIRHEDVAQALQNLERKLAAVPQQPEAAAVADEDEAPISLHTRALPLLELLQAACADEKPVRWE